MKLKEISHVSVVVKDLQKSMERYWSILGIGPWKIFPTFEPPFLKDTKIRGEEKKHSMKIAQVNVGKVVLELIQPLEGESVYKEFLRERGEGLHHIAFHEPGDEDAILKEFEEMGIKVLYSGRYKGVRWYYMDTEKIIGTVCEVEFGEVPEAEAIYP
jgi:catechol 2,3-dioxygenase-like lactoylglutathione lyase family enzyme